MPELSLREFESLAQGRTAGPVPLCDAQMETQIVGWTGVPVYPPAHVCTWKSRGWKRGKRHKVLTVFTWFSSEYVIHEKMFLKYTYFPKQIL